MAQPILNFSKWILLLSNSLSSSLDVQKMARYVWCTLSQDFSSSDSSGGHRIDQWSMFHLWEYSLQKQKRKSNTHSSYSDSFLLVEALSQRALSNITSCVGNRVSTVSPLSSSVDLWWIHLSKISSLLQQKKQEDFKSIQLSLLS